MKAFLPYLSDRFPISGVITTDPTPAICNINPFHFLFLHCFYIHPFFFFLLLWIQLPFLTYTQIVNSPNKGKANAALKRKKESNRVDIYGYVELFKLRRFFFLTPFSLHFFKNHFQCILFTSVKLYTYKIFFSRGRKF